MRTLTLDDDTASKLFLALEHSTDGTPAPVVQAPIVEQVQPAPTPTAATAGMKTIELPWGGNNRAYSKDVGGFGLADTLVCHFRTGPTESTKVGRLSVVEFQAGGPQMRHAVLSKNPGDMSTGFRQDAFDPSFFFTVGQQDPSGFAAKLDANTDYYLNLQNDPSTNEVAHEVQVTLQTP